MGSLPEVRLHHYRVLKRAKKRLRKFSTVQAFLTKNDDDLVLLVHAKKLFNAKRMHFGGHRGAAAEAEQSFFPESLNESGLPKLII